MSNASSSSPSLSQRRAGYDRKSALALALLVSTGTAVGYHWNDLLDANGQLDLLLLGIWLMMAALITWNVSARRDLALLFVGLCGGFVIEWWGTTTGLWRYFTNERPPLWILPAWPIAALSTDRIGVLCERLAHRLEARLGFRDEAALRRAYRVAFYLIVPPFVAGMIAFAWPARGIASTKVVAALMIALALRAASPRRDVLVFVAGAALGVFLEYWGTSRMCWTYYTQQVPPPIAILAHGFAAIAFARAADAVLAAWRGAFRTLGVEAQRQPENSAS
ncbi:MAG: hypothetical protein R3B13_40630 [Polyangiaceae bacterium]